MHSAIVNKECIVVQIDFFMNHIFAIPPPPRSLSFDDRVLFFFHLKMLFMNVMEVHYALDGSVSRWISFSYFFELYNLVTRGRKCLATKFDFFHGC